MVQKWRTIRLFISSTFRDMHAERDHLVRFIFPELKEKCRKRRVNLIDVDLRWGVTEADAQDGKALDICLDEIDSCRPYFLGLIGHRYGWTPPGQEHSITAQEIYHGVLHNDIPKQVVNLRRIIEGKLEGKSLSTEQINCLVRCYQWDAEKSKYLLREDITPDELKIIHLVFEKYSLYQRDRSFFFFRSEALTRKLARHNIEDFFESEEMDKEKLSALKHEIIDSGLSCFEYDNIEAFGNQVRDILWKRIEAELGEIVEKKKDWLEEEAEFHELFVTDRTRRFVGRRNLLDSMHAFCESDGESSVMVITGEPGCGKSALMGRFTEEILHNHPDWLIIPHFVGASPGSTTLRQTLRRFCTQIYQSCNFEAQKQQLINQITGNDETSQKERKVIEKEYSIPEDVKELKITFHEFLKKVKDLHKLIFILDAANQLEKADNTHDMRWLPQELPENVRFVASTLAGEAHEALLSRRIKPLVEEVTGLDDVEIKELVNDYLKEIRHEFPNKEVEQTFYEKVKGGNPLYILVALEELRVFGQFEELAVRVNELPDNVPALFDQVLERIESDFNRPLVCDCMSLIASGKHGMTAEELQILLRAYAPRIDSETEPEKLPDMLWARLYRAFSAYLFERSGVIDFFHGQLKEAVGNRYLRVEADRLATHKTIANYFESRWQEPYIRALDELPHQRTKAKDWGGVEKILCDLIFIEAKCAASLVFELLDDYLLTLDNLPERQTEIHAEREHQVYIQHWVEQMIIYTQEWSKRREQSVDVNKAEPKLPEAPPSFRMWTQNEIDDECRRMIENPTRSDRINAYAGFVRTGCYSLLTFSQRPGFVLQQAWSYAPKGLVHNQAGILLTSCTSPVLLRRWPANARFNLIPALVMTLQGHKGHVNSVALTPDGQEAVSGSSDNTLRAWDLRSGKRLRTLEGHNREVMRVAVTPDGRRAFSVSDDYTLQLWDLASSQCLRTFEGDIGWDDSVVVASDGQRAISGSSHNTLRLWDLASGQCLRTFQGHSRAVRSVAVTPDGRFAVSGSDDYTLRVWDLTTGQCLHILQGHFGAVRSVAVTPDGRFAVSGSHDYTIRVWDLTTDQCLRTLEGHFGAVISVAMTADGRYAVSAGSKDKTIKVWDLQSGQCLRTLEGHNREVMSVALTPDGRRAISGSFDKTIRVWNLHYGQSLRTIECHLDRIDSLVVTPDGQRVVSGSADNTLRVWEAQTGQCMHTLEGHSGWVSCVVVTPDGRRAISGSFDNTLRIWDLLSGQCLHILQGHTSQVWSLPVMPDGRRAVSGSFDNTLRIWDLLNGKCLRILEGHVGEILSLVLAADGSRVVSGSSDNTLRVWDLKKGRCMLTLQGHNGGVWSLAMLPDEEHAVSGGDDKTIRLWDLKNGQRLHTLQGHTDSVWKVAVTPDGRYAVSGSWDRTLRVWDLLSGQCVRTLEGHGDFINALVLTSDGQRAISGSSDGTVRVWDLSSGRCLNLFSVFEEVYTLAIVDHGKSICIGTQGGTVMFLDIQGIFPVLKPRQSHEHYKCAKDKSEKPWWKMW